MTALGLIAISGLLLFVSSKLWLNSAVAQPPVIPAAKGDQCVADIDQMRKNHMDMLNHQRDETVIDGVRGNPFSLVGCVDCHAQREADGTPVRIDAEGQFCESCHAFAAVKIDCFTCHAAVPDEADELIGSLHSHPAFSLASVATSSAASSHIYQVRHSAPVNTADPHAKRQ